MASIAQQVGGAVGLTVLVAVANTHTGGLAGQALRHAQSDGVRAAVYLAAAGIALGALVALTLRRHTTPEPAIPEPLAAESDVERTRAETAGR